VSKSIIERCGFYISRLSLAGFIVIAAYFWFLTTFVIHPESEVSMMGTLPLFFAAAACGIFIFFGEALRLAWFALNGFPKSWKEKTVHLSLLAVSGWFVVPFIFRLIARWL
jgi:hypothetical protein